MRVLIVGAGIAGAALAGFCERLEGVDYRVVERAADFDRVGYGIGLWHDGIAVLERLGVHRRVLERGNARRRVRFRTTTGADATVRFPADLEHPFVAVHRADLHESLLAAVPDEAIRFGTVPTAVDPSGSRATVELSTGQVEAYDLVVGADGVHSTVRNLAFDAPAPTDRGTRVWSFWTSLESFPETTTSVLGTGAEAFLTELGGRGLVNVATSTAAVPPGASPTDQLRAVCADLGWLLPAALERAAGELFHADVETVELDRWVRDGVALIGDAAHAVHPISGMGAALALEDAATLARELATAGAVRPALERYQRARRGPVRTVKRDAALLERLLFSESRAFAWLVDRLVGRPWLLERALGWYLRRLSRAQ